MAETILCLDIHEDKIAAVSVDNSSGVAIVKGYAVETLGQTPFPDVWSRALFLQDSFTSIY